MNLAAFLVAMVGPLAARLLASLGLSLVSVAGITLAYSALKTQLISNIASLPAKAIQLGGIFGVWEAIGVILGAMVFVMTWRGTSGFWKLAKT